MASHDDEDLGPDLDPPEAGTPKAAWSAAFPTVLRLAQVGEESSL